MYIVTDKKRIQSFQLFNKVYILLGKNVNLKPASILCITCKRKLSFFAQIGVLIKNINNFAEHFLAKHTNKQVTKKLTLFRKGNKFVVEFRPLWRNFDPVLKFLPALPDRTLQIVY